MDLETKIDEFASLFTRRKNTEQTPSQGTSPANSEIFFFKSIIVAMVTTHTLTSSGTDTGKSL